MSNLDDPVAAVAPYVSGALVSPENLSHIASLTGRLLPYLLPDLWIFECRLGVREAQGDFAIRFSAADGGREKLAGPDVARPELLGHPVWARFHQFCREWNTPTSILYRQISDVWLEFDVSGPPPPLPLPNIFFGTHSPAQSGGAMPSVPAVDLHRWVSEVALPLILGHTIPEEDSRKLLESLSRMPLGARVYQVGLMLAREPRGVRLCIAGMAPAQIPDYLRQLGWPGPVSELETVISRFAERAPLYVVDVDVAESIGRRIGLEFFFFEEGELGHRRCALLLDYLVEAGLCLPDKRAAVLAWPGYAPLRMDSTPWPPHNMTGASFGGLTVSGIFVKWLSHIKLTFQEDEPLEAKAYLSCLVRNRLGSL